jgi:hypothetical protein
MPQVAPIVALISAGIGAAGLGYSIYEKESAPGAPKPSAVPPPLTTQGNQQQAAAVGQQLPDLQSLTGGSLSPEYYAQFGAGQAGLSNDPRSTGNIQQAISQFFGLPASGTTGLTTNSISAPSGGPGILDMLKSSGTGTATPLSAGGGMPAWISSVLNGNEFRGLQA